MEAKLKKKNHHTFLSAQLTSYVLRPKSYESAKNNCPRNRDIKNEEKIIIILTSKI